MARDIAQHRSQRIALHDGEPEIRENRSIVDRLSDEVIALTNETKAYRLAYKERHINAAIAHAEKYDMAQQLTRLTNELKLVNHSHERSQERCVELQKKIVIRFEEIAALAKQINTLNNNSAEEHLELRKLIKNINEANVDIEKQRKEISLLKELNNSLEKEKLKSNEIKKAHDITISLMASLKIESKNAAEEKNRLVGVLTDLQTDFKEIKVKNADLQSEIKDLNSKKLAYTAAKITIETLIEKEKRQAKEINILKHKAEFNLENLKKNAAQFEQLSAKLIKSDKSLEQMKRECTNYKKDNFDLRQKIDVLSEKESALTAALSTIRELRIHNDLLLNSTSWKITSPIRLLKNTLNFKNK